MHIVKVLRYINSDACLNSVYIYIYIYIIRPHYLTTIIFCTIYFPHKLFLAQNVTAYKIASVFNDTENDSHTIISRNYVS